MSNLNSYLNNEILYFILQENNAIYSFIIEFKESGWNYNLKF